MKTKDRLLAIDASAKGWRETVPESVMDEVTLMRLIRVASQGISAFSDPLLRLSGLTESSYHTLIVVSASGEEGTTPSSLCEQVGQAHANMTRILNVLVNEKLVRIRPDSRDARRRRIVATVAGKRVVERHAAQFEPIINAAFKSLSATDRRDLQRSLRKLIESIDEAERLVGTCT